MDRALIALVLSSHLFVSQCQENGSNQDGLYSKAYVNKQAGPSYSFGYGINDVKTGDMKTAYESKDGDTVKGHYSVLEPNGSVRTVEYSANAKSGFQAVVKNEAASSAPTQMESKSSREYGRPDSLFDYTAFSSPSSSFLESERKRLKAKYPIMDEPTAEETNEYPSILSYRDYLKRLSEEEDEAKRHKYSSYSSKYKKDKKNESNKDKHKYSSILDVELTKPSRYPESVYTRDKQAEMLDDHHSDKYLNEHSNVDLSKIISGHFKVPKLKDSGLKSTSEKYKSQGEPYSELFEHMAASELSHAYPDIDLLKSKRRPSGYKNNKYSELLQYMGHDTEYEYVVLPKKKYKVHSKIVEPPSFDEEDDYEPHHTHDENCRHKDKNKEIIVKKIITKPKKPVINLLDIFDI